MKITRHLTHFLTCTRKRMVLAFAAIAFLSPYCGAGAEKSTVDPGKTIPFEQLGATAQKQYMGDGISITPTADGARLCAVFQKLEGRATNEGLWLKSTAQVDKPDRFRVLAIGVGRGLNAASSLPREGEVQTSSDVVRFVRAGLVEEYCVSMDGVRQDFIVRERPAGDGDLCILLKVSGARVEAARDGVKLGLKGCGRKIVYNRLHVSDANGRKLKALMEVAAAGRIRIAVQDCNAAYPVRIDPTFSDENWSTPGSGMVGPVYALAVSGTTLYAGGSFTTAGGVNANRIAKWNGSAWSALGSGMDSTVEALAVAGNGDLYAGGTFTTAGGVTVNGIAKWDGSSWSALGSGMGPPLAEVDALAVSGTTLYAGGIFTTAGGVTVNGIAKWDGSSWSALGSGMDTQRLSVFALAVSGTSLYAGGNFATAGGVTVNGIAKWDGSNWSALGSGMDTPNGWPGVHALAVSGTTIYAGGSFSTAGGVTVNHIAQWNGSAWSSLGTGMSGTAQYLTVGALAVASNGDLYAGGNFTTAGGSAANNIAKWDGASWIPLGSGIGSGIFIGNVEQPSSVGALVVSGSNLYAGGYFGKAGGKYSPWIAMANIASTPWPTATDLGNGWQSSNWFGTFNVVNYPWIYHVNHGWMYAFGTDPTSIWLWTTDMGFLWTGNTVYPFLWRNSDQTWIYYLVGSQNPRFFYNFKTSQWEQHSP